MAIFLGDVRVPPNNHVLLCRSVDLGVPWNHRVAIIHVGLDVVVHAVDREGTFKNRLAPILMHINSGPANIRPLGLALELHKRVSPIYFVVRPVDGLDSCYGAVGT